MGGKLRGSGKLAVVLALLACAVAAEPASAADPAFIPTDPNSLIADDQAETKPNHLLVVLDKDASVDKSALFSGADTTIADKLLPARSYDLRTTGNQTVDDAIAQLSDEPGVRIAEPVTIFQVQDVPNDPRYPEQWAMPAINAPLAWNRTRGSPNVTIGIVDTGADLDHPDLVDKMVPGYDFVDHDDQPDDAGYHGTAVMGAAGAATNNGIGIAGVDRGAKMMPLKACDYEGGCSSTDIIDAIVYARRAGVDIVNMSFSTFGPSLGLKLAMDDSPDILFVASAGNEGVSGDVTYYPGFTPCAYSTQVPNLICVASTDQNGQLSDFSNWGAGTNIAAPGRSILTAYNGGGYVTISGTSFSAPITAGAAGLLMAYRPSSTPNEIRRALENGQPSEELISSKPLTSGTRLDIEASLNFLDSLILHTAPANLDAPRLIGTPRVRFRLSSWPGRWNGDVDHYEYEWQHDLGTGFTVIAGATTKNYDPVPADAGHSIRLKVTAVDDLGRRASSISAPTGLVDGDPGPVRLVSQEAWATIDGKSPSEGIRDVAPLGDFNGDGFADVAITRGEFDWFTPAINVLLGPLAPHTDLADPPDRSFEIRTEGVTETATNLTVDPIGDFNGDGLEDLLVSESYPVRTWVIFGSKNPTDIDLANPGNRALKIEFDRYITSMMRPAPVGDVDGDGFDDIALDAIDLVGKAEYTHRLWIVYGDHNRDPVTVTQTLQGHRNTAIDGYAEYGYASTYGAGDTNGDGYDDIAVSAGQKFFLSATPDYPSQVTVMYGGPNGPAEQIRPLPAGRGWTIREPDDLRGGVPLDSGDVDGDGYSDISMYGWTEAGSFKSYVLWGGQAHANVDLRALPTSAGYAVQGGNNVGLYDPVIADLQGDGSSEPVFGSYHGPGLGRGLPGNVAALEDGRHTGTVSAMVPTPPNGVVLAGESNLDEMGIEVEAGDLNGDGTDDLLITAARYDPSGRLDTGRVYAVSWDPDSIEPQHPPTAVLNAPARVSGGTVTLDASASNDPDGTIKRFEWDLDGDGSFESRGGSTAQLVTHGNGAYPVAVRAVDDDDTYGNAVATVTVGPDPVQPVDPTQPTDPGGGGGPTVPSNAFRFAGGNLKSKHLDEMLLKVEVPGPGALSIHGRGLKSVNVRSDSAGVVEIPIRVSSLLKRKLYDVGKVKTTAEVKFLPDGGTLSKQKRTVKLVKLR